MKKQLRQIYSNPFGKLNAVTLSVASAFVAMSNIALAEQATVKGVAIGDNTVAVGDNAYATTKNGSAVGHDSVSTGKNRDRKEFKDALKIYKDDIENYKNARSAVETTEDSIQTNAANISLLTDTVDDLTQQYRQIEIKNNTRNTLIDEKNQKQTEASQLETNLNNSQTAYDYASVYKDFNTVLDQLDLSILSGASSSDDKRNTLAEGLKNDLEAKFNLNYTLNDYRNIVDLYIKTKGEEGVSNGKIAGLTSLKVGDTFFQNFNKPVNYDFSLNTVNISYSQLHQGSGIEQQYLNRALMGKVLQNNSITNTYIKDLAIRDDRYGLLTGSTSQYITNEFWGIKLKNNPQPVDNILKLEGEEKNNFYWQMNYAFRDSFNTYTIERNIDIIQQRIDGIDITDAGQVINVLEYKTGLETYLNLYKKLSDYIQKRKDYLNLINTDNYDRNTADQLLGEITLFQDGLRTDYTEYKNQYTFGDNEQPNITINREKEAEYFALVDNEYKDLVDKVYYLGQKLDYNNPIIKQVIDESNQIIDTYNNTKSKLDLVNNEIADLNRNIEDLKLTPEEEAVEELKQQKEQELAAAQTRKTQLEAELLANQNALTQAQDALARSDLNNSGSQNVAMGYQAFASGEDAIAIGTNTTAISNDSIAIGHNSLVTGKQSIAIGLNNQIESDDVVALGNNIKVGAGFNGAVVLGTNSEAAKPHPTASMEIAGTTYRFAGATPTSTVSVGKEGEERQITNVAAGRISSDSTDAVNGSQLYAVTEAIKTIGGQTQRINALEDKINRYKKRGDAGVAANAAMTNIPQVIQAGREGVGVGVGHHNGQNALAVGYSRASENAKHIVKLSAGVDTQSRATLGAGYMFQW